jgi:hypothetical protein
MFQDNIEPVSKLFPILSVESLEVTAAQTLTTCSQRLAMSPASNPTPLKGELCCMEAFEMLRYFTHTLCQNVALWNRSKEKATTQILSLRLADHSALSPLCSSGGFSGSGIKKQQMVPQHRVERIQ